jgi:hypothetical protein
MWKRLRSAVDRFWNGPRRKLDARRKVEARSRFWSDVDEGRREAEAASVAPLLTPVAER